MTALKVYLILFTALAAVAAQAQDADETVSTGEIRQALYFDPPVRLHGSAEQPTPESALSGYFAELSADVAPPPETQADINVREQDIEYYEAALAETELQGGAWASELSEELLSLGSIYQEQGEFERAIEVYDRAMHISRVNKGLYNLEQVEIVEERIKSHLALGQWQEADKHQQYAYHVQSRAFGNDDPRIIPVLENLAKWNVAAFSRGLGDTPGVRLLHTFQLYDTAANMVAVHFGENDPRFVGFLKELVGSAYLVARFGVGEVLASGPASSDVANAYSDMRRRSLSGFEEGEEALLKIIDHYAQTQAGEPEHARALADLADWYLMFDRRQAANASYREAFNVASLSSARGAVAAETSAYRNSLAAQETGAGPVFDDVVYLPTFSTYSEQQKLLVQLNSSRPPEQGFVDVAFNVNSYGKARDIEVLQIYPVEAEPVGDQLRRTLRASRFRPRLVDGEPVTAENVQFRFPFWY